MRKKIILSVLITLLSFFIYSQNNINLVPNWSFENGKKINGVIQSPAGEYDSEINPNVTIENHIANWKVAYHNDCNDIFNSPDWYHICYNKEVLPMNINLTSPYLYTQNHCSFDMHNDIYTTPSIRFMFLDSYYHYNRGLAYNSGSLCKKKNRAYEAIRVSLIEKLESTQTYLLKIKYRAMQKKFSCADEVVYTGLNTLRIHFSKWGPHWYSTNSNNQLWKNAAVIWKNANIEGDVDCNWHQATFEITVPSNMNQLGEMIIYCAEGAFFIDDVELYKKCPSTILVQNQTININHQPNAFFASETIIAGHSVNPSESFGDVTVNYNGSVRFIAGNEVRLKHGFSTNGGFFHAYNDICENSNKNLNAYEFESLNTEELLTIYPNPTQDFINISNGSGYYYEMFDSQGRKVLSGKINSDEFAVSTKGIKPGIYLINFNNMRDIQTQKIIIYE